MEPLDLELTRDEVDIYNSRNLMEPLDRMNLRAVTTIYNSRNLMEPLDSPQTLDDVASTIVEI